MTRSADCWQNRLLVLLTLCLLTAYYTLGTAGTVHWMLLAFVLLLPWALRYGDLRTAQLLLIFLPAFAVPFFFEKRPSVLVAKSIPVVFFFYLAFLIPAFRVSLDWLRLGHWNRISGVLAILLILLSAGGLMGWVHFAQPDMRTYTRVIAGIPPWLLPLYMGFFAALNAMLEEIVWRGVVQSALDSALGHAGLALVIQAAVFGMAHFQGGFPSGWSGAGLAGLFGLMMGILRRTSKGLLVPWCAHFAADFTVIWLIVRFAPHQV